VGLDINTVSRRAEVAQSVEQGTENPRVGSSILSLGTINNNEGLHTGNTPRMEPFFFAWNRV
jgi:hypothetical protein